MQKILKKMLVGAGLVAGLTTAAQAQYLTDAGSPLGGGGGASGSVANYVLSTALSFASQNTTGAGPAGATRIIVSEAARDAFLIALSGGGTAQLVSVLGGGQAAQTFANGLGSFLQNIGPASALSLIDAYNAVVDSPSASVEALATVRAGLVSLLQLKQ